MRWVFLTMIGLAQATSFLTQPFPSSVKDAPVIVRGTVGPQTYSDWVIHDTDGTKRLYTFFELKVSEVMKGQAHAETLFFRQMGGEKNGIGMVIPGSAEFKKGEEVVVFLNPKNLDGSFDLLSLMMGKYQVIKDENGTSILRGPGITEESKVVDSHGHSAGSDEESHNDSKPVKKWSLDDVRALIQKQSQNSDKAQKTPPSSVVKEKNSQNNRAPILSKVEEVSPLHSSTAEPAPRGWGFGSYAALAVVLALIAWYIKK